MGYIVYTGVALLSLGDGWLIFREKMEKSFANNISLGNFHIFSYYIFVLSISSSIFLLRYNRLMCLY